MKNRWQYAYSGLRVTSELQLPEWSRFEVALLADEDSTWHPDVHFLVGGTSDGLSALEAPFLVEPQRFHFQIPDVGSYRVENGRSVTVMALPHAGQSELRLFLLGSAWGALCYQRGLLPIHGSVVRVNDSAVAFCGPSGAGKSSTAAWLVKRGFQLLSDDLCIVDFSHQGRPAVWPSASRSKLWSSALQALGQDNAGLERDHFRMEKYHVPWREPVSSVENGTYDEDNGSIPLRAFYLLEWGEPGFAHLTGAGGLSHFIASATYRPRFVGKAGQMAAHWSRCMQLLRSVPAWQFTRPRDWNGMNDAVDRLQKHWCGLPTLCPA